MPEDTNNQDANPNPYFLDHDGAGQCADQAGAPDIGMTPFEERVLEIERAVEAVEQGEKVAPDAQIDETGYAGLDGSMCQCETPDPEALFELTDDGPKLVEGAAKEQLMKLFAQAEDDDQKKGDIADLFESIAVCLRGILYYRHGIDPR